jgi:hypothetical protein
LLSDRALSGELKVVREALREQLFSRTKQTNNKTTKTDAKTVKIAFATNKNTVVVFEPFPVLPKSLYCGGGILI